MANKILNYYSWRPQIGYSESYSLTVASEFDSVVDPVKKLSATETVSETDTVFFHSSSTIPRYKFSNFCEGKKTRRVINKDKATCVVVNSKALIEGVKSRAGYGQKTRYYEVPLSVLTGNNLGKVTFHAHASVKPEDIFFVEYRTWNDIRKEVDTSTAGRTILPTAASLNSEEYYLHYGGGNKKDLGDLIELKAIMDSGVKLVDDIQLNKQMGETQLVVDKDNFEEFDAMLKAKDEPTVRTGLELLANTNYDASIFYISLLLNGNRGVADAKLNTTVNLRNFREYFKDVAWNNNEPQFLRGLRNKLIKQGALTDVEDAYIHKNMLNYVNGHIKHAGVEVREVHFTK